jgi:lambda repressor-like predicted transcriptional regulator
MLKDQNKIMVNSQEPNNKSNLDNDDVREKIKNLIKKKNYNLRDLSRNLKKNDAYLQQYLYRGTPKVLPEEYRYLLAELLDVNVNELIPNWLKDLSSQEQFFILRNIENEVDHINQISFSKELLVGLDLFDVKNLYYFQTHISDCHIITIVDVSIKKFVKPDIYLLNDKKNFFLATIEFSKLSKSKLSVKPYLNNFSPFQIDANLLNINGKILWQCSKIFSK